jgi:hypothetical protein
VQKQDRLYFWVLVVWALVFVLTVIFLTPMLDDTVATY